MSTVSPRLQGQKGTEKAAFGIFAQRSGLEQKSRSDNQIKTKLRNLLEFCSILPQIDLSRLMTAIGIITNWPFLILHRDPHKDQNIMWKQNQKPTELHTDNFLLVRERLTKRDAIVLTCLPYSRSNRRIKTQSFAYDSVHIR